MITSIQDEINQIDAIRPHLVILGAGASLAALPDGDKNGKKLPLMSNFIEVLNLGNLLIEHGIKFCGDNFEDLYSEIYSDPKKKDICEELENRIYDYFSSLQLPEEPTIYDYLILSLREKDVIATFNWDPFLVQAIRRNRIKVKPPRVLFLHGNVSTGYCYRDKVVGIRGNLCSVCNKLLEKSKLLYPISQKNYDKDFFISKQWSEVKVHIKNTFMVTIFGYSAPNSDISAIEIMKTAWGEIEERAFEQIEIIDIKEENSILESWGQFIHTHHYDIYNDFFDSWIANHPRRTGEAFRNQYIEAMFIDDNSPPKATHLTDLQKWYKDLIEGERAHN